MLIDYLQMLEQWLEYRFAGRDLPAAKLGRAIATSAELLAKQSF
jgi:hypothetical protein